MNCEVDPLKLNLQSSSLSSSTSTPFTSQSATLRKNRNNLIFYVEDAWRRILNTIEFFPHQLRHIFSHLRLRLEKIGRGELADNLISSSIFLRFLCPAILSPSLFNLVTLYFSIWNQSISIHSI